MSELDYTLFKEKFIKNVTQHNKIISTTIELTTKCNFRCVHCYLGEDKNQPIYIDKDIVIDFLIEVKKRGCIYLVFTGGEPLMHPQFIEIYKKAFEIGFIITLFTNGTTLTNDHYELFKKYKPFMVEISLYGIDEKSYKEFTMTKGSYDKVIDTINNLKKMNINIRFKTMLLKNNISYITDMEKFAENYGCEFRWDAYIIPTINNDLSPIMNCLLDEDEIVSNITHNKILSTIIENKLKNRNQLENKLHPCGSGKNAFFLDASCNLTPCVMVRDWKYNIKDKNFDKAFEKMLEFADCEMPENYKCRGCENISFCRYCPSKFKLETGDIQPIERYCRIAQKIKNAILNKK